MKWNVAMHKTDFHVLELFCRASHVRASMHRITSLELLRTLMFCLVQLGEWRECKAMDAEKLLSQWEKVAKCNFKSKAQVHERCFFLMKWNVICNAEDRFSFVRAFCRASHVRASMHRITSLELLRTLMLCLVQLSKWRECKATDAEKLLSQWEKVAKCNFKSKTQVHERCFFLMKWNVICNAEDRFSCVRAFCRASHVRASMHRITSLELLRTLMLCLVQLSKWRECKATDAEKLLLSERKLLNAILRVKLKYMKDVSFSWNEMLFAMQKTDFHV